MPPKLNRNWTYEKETILIDFYAAHDVLWRVFKATNEHIAKKTALLDQLASLLDGCFTVEEIHKRFAALRSTFRDNQKRVAQSRKNGDDVYWPTFIHFDRLSFLADTFLDRRSRSKIHRQCLSEQEHTPQSDQDEEGEVEVEGEVEEEEGDEKPELYSVNVTDFLETALTKKEPCVVSVPPRVPSSSAWCSLPVPAKKAKPADNANNSVEDLSPSRFTQSREAAEEDDSLLFGAHVGANLKKMTSFNAASARIAIEQALLLYCSDNPNNPNNKL